MNKRPPFPPLLILSVGVLAVSVSAILIRLAQDDAAPSLVIAAWRLTLATAILLPICYSRNREEVLALRPPDIFPAMLSGLFLALHFATWISSLNYTSVAASTILVTTAPVWVALASPFLLKERVPRPVQIGIALALAGSVIGVLDSMGGNSLLGNGLALVGAITAAAYLIIGRRLRKRVSLITYITLVYGMAAIVLVIIALAAGYDLFAYTPRLYLLFLLMAVFPQLLGHSSFNWALGYLPAAFVTVTIISEPIGATVLAFLIFQEVPTGLTLFGGVLILLGVIVSARGALADG